MSPASQPSEIVTLPDPAALAEAAAQRFAVLAAEAIRARGRFTVALAGGGTPAELYRRLAQPPYREQVEWPSTLVFFGDERCVPPDHPWSNYRMAHETLLSHVPLSLEHIYRMAGESTPEAAEHYAAALRRAFGLRGAARPRFDLVLLGMGADGHTASLFPGMAALGERRRLVIMTPVPDYVKPGIARITLTVPVLNAARTVMFLVAGASKAEAVRSILSPSPTVPRPVHPPLPASQVHPVQGRLIWLLDHAAAAGTR